MQCGTAEQGLYRYDLVSNTIKPNGVLMCTHFKISNVASLYNALIHSTQQKVIFYTNIATLDAFKAFLSGQYASGTAVEIVYELETEVIEYIDCSNKITQYDEQTTIYNRDGAEIEVSLTNNKPISEINEDIKKTQEVEVYDLVCSEYFEFRRSEYYNKAVKYGKVVHISGSITSKNKITSGVPIAKIPSNFLPTYTVSSLESGMRSIYINPRNSDMLCIYATAQNPIEAGTTIEFNLSYIQI